MISFLVLVFVVFYGVGAKIPPYIKVCKRDDPNLGPCIIQSIEFLRPKLKEGIPELNVPPLEPLPLDEIKLVSGPGAQIDANITNLIVHGASQFKITDLKPDLAKTRFLVQFTIPTLYFEGDYDIDMNILVLKYKGKGPITGNFTNYVFNCLLKADKIQKGNKTYIQFKKFALTLHTGKSDITLGGLFGDNGAILSAATNQFLKENSDLFIDEIRPALENSLAEKFTNIANSITSRFTYEELFPK
ncbi:unnamed protein product [Ceutorhynchus assimilis]|uniref:Uncharacterized protein n=1 Tax=Ceutorhynchus assimilis TaxID=467358 RepID=A0A9N9MNF6_9CUCU|nr:unnamed protein product [Ceutorhynchus assimilis]